MATDNTPQQLSDQQRQAATQQFAMANPAVPKIYGNGFGVNLGTADVGLLVTLNDIPAGYISLSYPMAKRLGSLLLEAAQKYEEITSTQISDLLQLETAVRKASQEAGK